MIQPEETGQRLASMARLLMLLAATLGLVVVVVGMISIQLIKRNRLKSLDGELITLADKKYNHGTWIGGTIFGLGWALTGACPGPLFAQLGAGVGVGAVAVLILAALAGTWTYSALREKLPR